MNSNNVNWIMMTRKSGEHLFTAHTETLDCLFDLIRSHQRFISWSPSLEIEPATTDCRAETLQLSISPCRTQVTPNQLVMVIAQPINLNVSFKLHLYSLQGTRSPPGPRLLSRIGNTHPINYYNLKDKDIDLHFFKKWRALTSHLKKKLISNNSLTYLSLSIYLSIYFTYLSIYLHVRMYLSIYLCVYACHTAAWRGWINWKGDWVKEKRWDGTLKIEKSIYKMTYTNSWAHVKNNRESF